MESYQLRLPSTPIRTFYRTKSIYEGYESTSRSSEEMVDSTDYIIIYLDDILIVNKTPLQTRQDTELTITLLRYLDFIQTSRSRFSSRLRR